MARMFQLEMLMRSRRIALANMRAIVVAAEMFQLFTAVASVRSMPSVPAVFTSLPSLYSKVTPLSFWVLENMPEKLETRLVSQLARPLSDVIPRQSLNISCMVMNSPALRLVPSVHLPIWARTLSPSTPAAPLAVVMQNISVKSLTWVTSHLSMPRISFRARQPLNIFFMLVQAAMLFQPFTPEETRVSFAEFSNIESKETAYCISARAPSNSTRLP